MQIQRNKVRQRLLKFPDVNIHPNYNTHFRNLTGQVVTNHSDEQERQINIVHARK